MIPHTFQVRRDVDTLLRALYHRALDVCGDAVCLPQRDVIGEEEVDIHIMHLPGVAVTQRPGKPRPVQDQTGLSTRPGEIQVGRRK